MFTRKCINYKTNMLIEYIVQKCFLNITLFIAILNFKIVLKWLILGFNNRFENPFKTMLNI